MKKLSLLTIAAAFMAVSSQFVFATDQAEAADSFVTAANESEVNTQGSDEGANWQGLYEEEGSGDSSEPERNSGTETSGE